MDDLIRLLEETGIPFAYDHFAEGESLILRSFATFCPRAITFPQMGRFI